VTSLNHLIEALLLRFAHDGAGVIRGVHRGGWLVELRIRPDAIAEACQGTEAMHTLSRRWSALRWVRRVRPAFVLTGAHWKRSIPRSSSGSAICAVLRRRAQRGPDRPGRRERSASLERMQNVMSVHTTAPHTFAEITSSGHMGIRASTM
jgi:hypothetical protein